MRCPRDDTALTQQNYEAEVLVDSCPACRGIWLDKGELERIEETRERKYSGEQLGGIQIAARAYEMARQKAQPGITCPNCSTALDAREYAYCSQIVMDQCPKCRGIWLDAGEVAALEQFFERETGTRKGFLASLLDSLVGPR